MHFWRIESLKDQLRRGPLPQRAAFAYLIATLFALTTAGVSRADPEPVTPLYWAAYAVSILFMGGGSYASYRANGGSVGSDFVPRYLAIGWVLGIRLIVMLVVPALVLRIGADLVWPEKELTEHAADRLAAALGVGFNAVFYWRLVHHVREIATFAPRHTESREAAG